MQRAAQIQWSYPGQDASHFVLERSIDSASSWPRHWLLEQTQSSYIDSEVNWGGSYWYRLAAGNARGIGTFSPSTLVYIMPPAFDLASITASQDENELRTVVTWNYSGSFPGSTDFFLYERSTDGTTWISQSVGPTITGSVETNVTYSRAYWYRVIPHCDMDLYATSSNVTRSFIQAPTPIVYTWQTGSRAIVFWNYLGTLSMSLSRSSDGGVTWPYQTVIAPVSASTYYFIDPTTSVGNTYQYRIREIAEPNQPSADGPLKTIGTSSVVNLAIVGDAGFELGNYTPWEVHTASLHNMNNVARGMLSASRFVLLGDNGYGGPTWKGGYQGQCFEMLGPSESIWAGYGNHDSSNFGSNTWRNMFGLPSTSYTWKEGCVFCVSLNVTSETSIGLLSGSTQWIFLSQSLSQSLGDPSISWRIINIHAPVLSSNWRHPGNWLSALVPWEKWGVDAIFAGHNHAVERLESGSVAHVLCGGGSNEKSPYYLRAGSGSIYSKWYNVDADDGFGPYSSGYIFTHVQATNTYMSISFYSGSTKLMDTGSTSIPDAVMAGGSLILRHLVPQAAPVLSSSLLVELPPQAIPSLTSSTMLV